MNMFPSLEEDPPLKITDKVGDVGVGHVVVDGEVGHVGQGEGGGHGGQVGTDGHVGDGAIAVV